MAMSSNDTSRNETTKTDVSANEKAQLLVNIDLFMSLLLQTYTIQAGGSIKFVCGHSLTSTALDLYPNSSLVWTFNELPLTMDPSRIVFFKGNVELTDLRPSDTGVYSCSVQSRQGNKTENVTLGVFTLQVTTDWPTIIALENESMKLDCHSYMVGQLFKSSTRHWLHNGSYVTSPPTKNADNTSDDVVYRVTKDMKGVWECQVFHSSTDRDWMTAWYLVAVDEAPSGLDRLYKILAEHIPIVILVAVILISLSCLLFVYAAFKERATEENAEKSFTDERNGWRKVLRQQMNGGRVSIYKIGDIAVRSKSEGGDDLEGDGSDSTSTDGSSDDDNDDDETESNSSDESDESDDDNIDITSEGRKSLNGKEATGGTYSPQSRSRGGTRYHSVIRKSFPQTVSRDGTRLYSAIEKDSLDTMTRDGTRFYSAIGLDANANKRYGQDHKGPIGLTMSDEVLDKHDNSKKNSLCKSRHLSLSKMVHEQKRFSVEKDDRPKQSQVSRLTPKEATSWILRNSKSNPGGGVVPPFLRQIKSGSRTIHVTLPPEIGTVGGSNTPLSMQPENALTIPHLGTKYVSCSQVDERNVSSKHGHERSCACSELNATGNDRGPKKKYGPRRKVHEQLDDVNIPECQGVTRGRLAWRWLRGDIKSGHGRWPQDKRIHQFYHRLPPADS